MQIGDRVKLLGDVYAGDQFAIGSEGTITHLHWERDDLKMFGVVLDITEWPNSPNDVWSYYNYELEVIQ